MLGGSVPGEEEVPNEEHEIHEFPELDRPAVATALRVFAGSQAEVETNGDQVGDVVVSGFRGGSCLCDNGLDDPKAGCLFLSDRGIFEGLGLELPHDALVEPGV